jgi:hypothetical protein
LFLLVWLCNGWKCSFLLEITGGNMFAYRWYFCTRLCSYNINDSCFEKNYAWSQEPRESRASLRIIMLHLDVLNYCTNQPHQSIKIVFCPTSIPTPHKCHGFGMIILHMLLPLVIVCCKWFAILFFIWICVSWVNCNLASIIY